MIKRELSDKICVECIFTTFLLVLKACGHIHFDNQIEYTRQMQILRAIRTYSDIVISLFVYISKQSLTYNLILTENYGL